jgi:hypothetical protein
MLMIRIMMIMIINYGYEMLPDFRGNILEGGLPYLRIIRRNSG